mmetsp:Transcript_44396/g.111166  ORF Transcript_44396/g.111166 Transcript_44396/m.111166 type:complete len:237 (+) Transcript_44396:17-727(+)
MQKVAFLLLAAAAVLSVSLISRATPRGTVELVSWQSGPLAGTAPLVTQCAQGNNAACDRLAADPSAMGALRSVNAADGYASEAPANEPNSWWKQLGLKQRGGARRQQLVEVAFPVAGGGRTQGLSDFMGEHWLIPGLDALPKDDASGNALFDFGAYDGTPVDPSTNLPTQGTLDDRFIKKQNRKRPWLFDINKIRRSEDRRGTRYPKVFPSVPKVGRAPRVDIMDGHIAFIDDATD